MQIPKTILFTARLDVTQNSHKMDFFISQYIHITILLPKFYQVIPEFYSKNVPGNHQVSSIALFLPTHPAPTYTQRMRNQQYPREIFLLFQFLSTTIVSESILCGHRDGHYGSQRWIKTCFVISKCSPSRGEAAQLSSCDIIWHCHYVTRRFPGWVRLCLKETWMMTRRAGKERTLQKQYVQRCAFQSECRH